MTMRARPKHVDRWKAKGFYIIKKRGEDRLLNYWWRRYLKEDSVKKLACEVDESFKRRANLYAQNLPRIEPSIAISRDLRTIPTPSIHPAFLPTPTPTHAVTPTPPTTPTNAQMVSSLAKSMLSWAKQGFKVVSQEVLDQRLAICAGCDLWDKEALAGTGRCTKCGCSTQAKLRLATEKCPIDKWLPVLDGADPKNHPNVIFVQIASYRDPQLVPTLDSMFENAEFPQMLRVCIAWQHDETESLGKYAEDNRVQVIDIPYMDSHGACWARNQIQSKYGGEKYTLQIDSHMRFNKNWDTTLIEMLEGLRTDKVKKPVITAYPSRFYPDNDPAGRGWIPWQMNFYKFTDEGVASFRPGAIKDVENLTAPMPAKFYAAGFCFADGLFCKEVPHDPDYYFHGEEISITARAYTNGYDLFHPHKVILWHEYTRDGQPKHWEDNKSWGEKNKKSQLLNRQLFGMDGEDRSTGRGVYGLGTERPLESYEMYAGLCFKDRSVATCNTNDSPAPCSSPETPYEEWRKGLKKIFRNNLYLQKSDIDPIDEFQFVVTAIFDQNGVEIHRRDFSRDELKKIGMENPNSDNYPLVIEFFPVSDPKSWLIWPNSTTRGWLPRITGKL